MKQIEVCATWEDDDWLVISVIVNIFDPWRVRKCSSATIHGGISHIYAFVRPEGSRSKRFG
jgi:hypothetical protein